MAKTAKKNKEPEIKEETEEKIKSASPKTDAETEDIREKAEVSEKESEEKEVEEKSSDTENEEGSDQAEEDSKPETPEYKALNEKYLRLYAEFDNFRKRSAKESLEHMLTANSNLLTKLIPTLENFEMAFSPEQKATKLEDFEKGIKMIFNSFKDVLEDAGMEEINPEGEEFDPNFHEALLEQNHDTVEEGDVIQVFQKGYKVKSKILKHAKVIISKGKQ